MKESNLKKARLHLEKLRHMVSRRKNPFSGLSEEEAIKEIRKTREKLWEAKLAGHRS